MKRTLIALALVATTVTACQKTESRAPEGAASEVASADAPASADAAASASTESSHAARSPMDVLPNRPESRGLSLDLPSLAYTYDFSLEAPAASIPDMMRRHEQMCVDSGPTQCQVLGSDLKSEGRDEARGRLDLRATQAWVRMFRPALAADARDAGGELRGAGADTEDLTQSVADTDAALKSKIAVRDRLRDMLKRPGKLDDVMEVSAQLERVQAEIDAAQSSLTQLNTRVEAARVSVDYASIAPIAPESAFRPFKGASTAFVKTFMGVLASLTWIAAVALPFVIIFGPVVWMFASRRKKAVKAAAE